MHLPALLLLLLPLLSLLLRLRQKWQGRGHVVHLNAPWPTAKGRACKTAATACAAALRTHPPGPSTAAAVGPALRPRHRCQRCCC